MRRRLAIALGLSLALPILGLRGWIALQRGDGAPPDDRDLRAPLAALAERDDGFAQLAAAAEAAVLPLGSESWDRLHAFRAGARGADEWVAALAEPNAGAVALLRASVATPRLRIPLEANSARSLARLVPLVAIVGADARLRAPGDPAAAIERASLGLRAARQIGGADDAGLTEVALAGTLAAMSLSDLDDVVRTLRMTPARAREIAALLEANRWTREAWSAVWAHEYARAQSGLAAVPASARGDAAQASGVPRWAMRWVPLDYLWQPNRTQAALADLYRDQQHKSGLSCAEAKLWPPHTDRPARGRRLARLLAPNLVGELIIEFAPLFDDAQRQRCHLESAISLVQALTAVKAHWDARGALPEQLDELVPRYLDSLPLDRFDGLPIRYSRAGAILSSIGDDLAPARPANARPHLYDAPEPALSLVF